MDNNVAAGELLVVAAKLLREGGRLPRGATEALVGSFADAEIGASGSGRTKYRRGVTADALEALGEALSA